ncbi:hypothetical protein [Burkholderia ubonensis]|uniref:hypothetical protein n=1 Tax=Burkholderia ubonensis TaxID=101571 RepID=UPI001E3E029D|nr:hypothetical protein [Burkholderia ubonensis]
MRGGTHALERSRAGGAVGIRQAGHLPCGERRRIADRARDPARGRVHILGQAARGIDLRDLAASRIVQIVRALSDSIGFHAQPAGGIVGIANLRQQHARRGLGHRHPFAGRIEGRRACKTVAERDDGLVPRVVVTIERRRAVEAARRQHAAQAVVRKLLDLLFARRADEALQQTAERIVDVARLRHLARPHAGIARAVLQQPAVARHARDVAAKVVRGIGARAGAPVGQARDPAGHVGLAEARPRVAGAGIRQCRNLLTEPVVPVFGHPPLRIDDEAQMPSRVINVGRGGGFAAADVGDLLEQFVVCAIAPLDHAAGGVALPDPVAARVVAVFDAAARLFHLHDVAGRVVMKPLRAAGGRHDLDEAARGVVREHDGRAERIGDRRPTRVEIVGNARDAWIAVVGPFHDARDPVFAAQQSIRKRHRDAVRLLDRRHPLAVAVVTIGRLEHPAVRNAVVVGRKIDRHRRQAARRVIPVVHRGRRAQRAVLAGADGVQPRKPPTRVVEIRLIPVRRPHAAQQARAVIRVVDLVAVAVHRRDQAPAAHRIVVFEQALGAVPPDPLPRSGVIRERRPRACAARRDVEPPLRIVAVDNRRAVPVGARHRTARLVQLAGKRADRARAARSPTVSDEFSLAVVGAVNGAVDAASDQHQVAILDDQVAVRRIHVDLLARLAERCGAELAACSQTQGRRRLQAQPVTRDDRYHVAPRSRS